MLSGLRKATLMNFNPQLLLVQRYEMSVLGSRQLRQVSARKVALRRRKKYSEARRKESTEGCIAQGT